MTDVSSIQRTSNIIVSKQFSFLSASNKKTWMTPIAFSDDEAVITDLIASQYANYKNGTTAPAWCIGVNTINREVDIITPYNNGAKYIYVLSSAFAARSSGTINVTTGAMALIKPGTPYTMSTQYPSVIKKHPPADEGVASQNLFDAYIVELLYELEPSVTSGMTKAVFSYIASPGPYTIPNTQTYSYNHSILNKPFAYFVYET